MNADILFYTADISHAISNTYATADSPPPSIFAVVVLPSIPTLIEHELELIKIKCYLLKMSVLFILKMKIENEK
jgi:hypothetical protein